MREIALDTETTGLNPESGHRVVEIGCVEMINSVRTGESYHVYLNPERDMPQEAFAVHGLSEDFLSGQPLFKDAVDEFLEFIGEDPLVIHNAGFDMRFLNHELKMLGKEEIPMSRAIDTVLLARRKFPGSPVNLDALCRRYEIDLSARTLHGALLDAELLADVYVELIGGKQSVFDLNASKAAREQMGKEKTFREAREFPAQEAEIIRHEEFVQKLDNPVWVESGYLKAKK